MRKTLLALIATFPAAAPAETVIAALGDSLTQGYGLTQAAGFVPQLERWLTQQGADLRLINAGVSGDTTAGGLARVDWTLTPEIDGLIVALGGNDVLRGLDPDTTRENLAGILDAARAADVEVLLVGMQAPGNFGPDYQDAFNTIYPDLARAYDVTLAPSFFEGLTEDGSISDPASLRAFFQPDGIHPNEAGIARIVEALGPRILAFARSIDD